jgi:putative transposase
VFWKHLSTTPAPFGELAWDHARQQLAAGGKRPAEAEIAQAVDAMLRRAQQGPRRIGPAGQAAPEGAREGPPGRRTHQSHRPAQLAAA